MATPVNAQVPIKLYAAGSLKAALGEVAKAYEGAHKTPVETTFAMALQDAATTTRLQDLLDENRRLQTELDDATEKLNAITSIEQSIRERENGTE
jgi:hypothetical protein